MNGEIYRLNIRFDLTDESQRSIAERLQALDRKQYGSINKFIIAAIGKAFDSNDSSTLTAEEVRSIIREELQDVAFLSAQPSQTKTVQPTLTEEEQVANKQSVLNDLEMFGAVGTGVAMGNALPQVRACADMVTDTVENDGIAHALQKLKLIE